MLSRAFEGTYSAGGTVLIARGGAPGVGLGEGGVAVGKGELASDVVNHANCGTTRREKEEIC
jgi:hypothetical protein